MAAISSYPYDLLISDKDSWIGTDSVNRKTKQYSAEALSNYLNTNGKVSVGGKMVYMFSTLPYGPIGTFSLPNGGAVGVAFSEISSLKMSRLEKSKQNTTAWIEYLVGDQILISSQSDIQAFGHYRVTSYTVDSENSNFYDIVLEYLGGNGSLVPDVSYDIVNFVLERTANNTFTYPQPGPSSSWTIQHNLGKFPSVTTVNSNDIEVKGEIEYIDENNLTVTFSAGFSGKAYLN